MRSISTLLVVTLVSLFACSSSDDGDVDSDASGSKTGDGGKATAGGGRALSSSPKQGVATYYDADGSGNCSFAKSPKDLDVVALALPGYNESAACGACLRVTGPKGDVTVRVVDSCPPCEGSGIDLDLSAEAFAKIANPKDGRVSITYQAVSCATTGNLAFHFKDGSSKWWTAIQVRNHRVPIAKLEYKRGSTWTAMEREDYNFFVEHSGVGDQPSGLVLRVTSSDGQVIEETLPGSIPSDKTVAGTKQFQ
ncbi:MAG TPA: expansin EXLX1 family cellulose-binding protein [Labilithrix sp.]|nr:expansin EXLX1 family cellulose-binding protein [Labilithrix sp.]